MATKQPTERQRKDRARRKAQGPAIIQRPLGYVTSRTNTKYLDKEGHVQSHDSLFTREARRYALEGNGAGVRDIARRVARSNGGAE